MGYGSRAITALNEFYSGELLNLSEVAAEMEVETFEDVAKTEKVSSIESYSRSLMSRKESSLPMTSLERITLYGQDRNPRRFEDASSSSTTFRTYS